MVGFRVNKSISFISSTKPIRSIVFYLHTPTKQALHPINPPSTHHNQSCSLLLLPPLCALPSTTSSLLT